jgi:hypothetical protein
LHDQQGRLVWEYNRSLGNTQTLEFDLEGLSKGIYVLKVRSGDFVTAEKLVVH